MSGRLALALLAVLCLSCREPSAPPTERARLDATVPSSGVGSVASTSPPEAGPSPSSVLASDASAPDTFVEAFDAGPGATSAKLALKKPASVCGMTVTLVGQTSKEYANPEQGSVGEWTFTMTKGGKTITVESSEASLYVEGIAHNCLYLLTGEYGSELVTAFPTTIKPMKEEEALELAEREVKARDLPHGQGRASTNRDGVVDVTFSGKSGDTRVRVGLFTRRILSIAVHSLGTKKSP